MVTVLVVLMTTTMIIIIIAVFTIWGHVQSTNVSSMHTWASKVCWYGTNNILQPCLLLQQKWFKTALERVFSILMHSHDFCPAGTLPHSLLALMCRKPLKCPCCPNICCQTRSAISMAIHISPYWMCVLDICQRYTCIQTHAIVANATVIVIQTDRQCHNRAAAKETAIVHVSSSWASHMHASSYTLFLFKLWWHHKLISEWIIFLECVKYPCIHWNLIRVLWLVQVLAGMGG